MQTSHPGGREKLPWGGGTSSYLSNAGEQNPTSKELADSQVFFPVVGLFIGALLAGLDWLLRSFLPAGVSGALVLLAWVFLTGGLHLDGLMDTCDGVFGGRDPERRRDIMADPHVGSYGIIGAVLVLLVKFSVIAALPAPPRWAALVLVPAISRWAMVLAITFFPYARPQGLGLAFQQGNKWATATIAGLIASVAALILLRWEGFALLLACSFVAWALGKWLSSLLEGLTGDTYGAINEVTEAVALLALISLLSLAIP